MKRFLSALIICCILLTLVPMHAFAAVTEVTEAKFDEKLADFIKNVYPNGSTFNNADGYGTQCFGFVNCISKKIFGSYPTQYMAANGTINSNWKISRGSAALKNVTKGDVIRINLHDDVDHSIFVTLVTSSTIYFSDANWDHANGVRHYASMTRTQLETYLDRKLKLGSNLNGEIGYIAHYKGFVADIDTVKPSAPTGLKGTWLATTDGSSKAKISWKAVDNADYYQVQYKREGIDWKTDGDYKVPVNLSYTSKGLKNYSSYSYRVRAVNDAGVSAWSETLTINKKITITFNPNGGTVSPTSMTATYKDGVLATYKNLPTPVWDGHTFVGWYTSLTGTTKVENSTTITATKNYSIYAHWEEPETNWSSPTYTWSEDNSTVTAMRYNLNNSSETEKETVNTTYAVIEAADCEVAGIGVYTATFTNPAFTTQSKNIVIPALGHDLIDHAAYQATCTEAGWNAYQTCSRCDYTTYVEQPALGHNYVDGVCTRCGAIDPEFQPNVKLTIYGSNTTAVPGGTVTIPVMIKGGENFAGFTLTVASSAGLTLKKIEKGALLKNADGMFTANVEQKSVNWTSSTNVAGTGELLVLTFDVGASVADGSQLTIKLGLKDNKPSNMADANEKPIGVKFEDITVAVQTTLFGDVNSDGDVDTIDAIRLAKYLVDLVELTDAQVKAADVNGDNDVTTTDAIRLAKYLVGLVDSLRQPPVRAAVRAADEAAISVESATCKSGETVTIPVKISRNPGFAGFTLTINAADGLTLTDIEKGTLLAAADGMFTKNVAQKRVNWTGSENVNGNGELLVLTFAVDESAANGDYAVSVELKDGKQSNFANAAEQPIAVSFAAGKVTVSNHEHSYTAVVTPPTCTEQGYTTHTCSVCGDSYVDTYVPALGHDIVTDAAVAPTCTETGLTAGEHCTRCDYKIAQETVPALGHNIVRDAAVAATCTDTGLTEGSHCSRCDYAVAQETVPALGHDMITDAAVAATCTDTGLTEGSHCSRCDYAVAQETVPALGHDMITDAAVAATCTDTGLTEGSHCSRCDYKVAQETVPALGHTWNDGEITKPATETEDGVKTYTCTRCGATKTELIPATGETSCKHEHAHPDHKDADCTEPGYDRTVCDDCGKVLSETVIPALGHDIVKDEPVPATCTETGLTEGEHCTRCDYKIAQEIIAALGHDWDEGKITTPATETTDGVKTYTCTRCGATKTEAIPATGGKPCDGGKDCPSYNFRDVNYGDWYHEAVDFAVTRGLFNGMTATTFEPNTPMTRGMLVTVLWRYEKEPSAGKNTFVDVKAGDWYEKAVAWAAENGIVNGVGNGKFDPNGKITREQMAAILFRYSDYKGYDVSKRDDFAGFPDKAKVSAWAKDAMGWAVAEKLITGNSGRLDPQGNATRAQVATILMRFIMNIAE